MPAAESNKTIKQRWDEELFGVQRSIRYHARRQAFFESWDTITNAVSIIFGAGTVAVLLNEFGDWGKSLQILFPAAITIISTFNLVWGTVRAARTHNELLRRFVELEQQMLRTPLDENSIAESRIKRLTIEADEPPVKFAVDFMCHNELVKSLGGNNYYDVKFRHRVFGHIWPFEPADFHSSGNRDLQPN